MDGLPWSSKLRGTFGEKGHGTPRNQEAAVQQRPLNVADAVADLIGDGGSAEAGRLEDIDADRRLVVVCRKRTRLLCRVAHISEIAGRLLKRVSCELGGKNAIVVLDDADVDLSIEGIVWSAFGTSGQRCTAASRVIAHKGVANNVIDKLVIYP